MGKKITAVILAGGKGERLQPITNFVPKPMVMVKGKPILEHIINLLIKNGITQIIISLCYKPQSIKNYFGNGKKFGAQISYIVEKEDKPLGTAGAIAKLRNKINKTFLVIYGDILRELNINKLLFFHKKKKAFATICVYENKSHDPKSLIIFDNNFIISKFIERPKEIKKRKVWSNASFYVFEPDIFAYLSYNHFADFGKDIFPKVVGDNKKLFAFVEKGYFLDIGDIKKLDKAKKGWKNYAVK